MFQVETVDDCSGIPRNVIEHATPVVFPNCRDTRAKEAKNIRIDYGLVVHWDKRSQHRPYFACSKESVRQRISLENGEPEVKFGRIAYKEVEIRLCVLLTESAQWRGGHAGVPTAVEFPFMCGVEAVKT
ncbi:hypothetical protein G6F70_005074 [Rhizopus microsporus]|nr:hypothetical protein G6F71_003368 [Rhizopus microsporus]KAG1199281.1 hypothetical protein G6F70_005074 [Rhizopus microsporus]KAG1213022.1 hypothetical protein G6F69_003169 [Rhizopus microsporus]KAG1235029.1 hypothetical protein G6F67_003090 [Rhizopus microsporus]KAG1266194.1 hypothetical protein G6F68_002968 [Rhizopus microsporus]